MSIVSFTAMETLTKSRPQKETFFFFFESEIKQYSWETQCLLWYNVMIVTWFLLKIPARFSWLILCTTNTNVNHWNVKLTSQGYYEKEVWPHRPWKRGLSNSNIPQITLVHTNESQCNINNPFITRNSPVFLGRKATLLLLLRYIITIWQIFSYLASICPISRS